MTEHARDVPAERAFDALKAQISAYVRYAMERPSRYQLLFAAEPIDTTVFPDVPGVLQPVTRAMVPCMERLSAQGVLLPMSNPISAAVLVISLAHGRIAIAHVAPHRPGNAPAGVETFVLDAVGRFFNP